MLRRSKIRTTLRFILWTALLVIETSFIAAFYVVPQFHVQTYDTHPALRLEIDAVVREHPWLPVAAIMFLGLFVLANIGLVIVTWRALKDLRSSE